MMNMKLDHLKQIGSTTLLLSGVLTLVATATVGCTPKHPELHSEPNVELIQDMMDQPAIKPQHFMPSTPEVGASRLPPEGTVPVGYKPYPYHLDPITAAKMLKNPLAGQMSPEVLEQGRKRFETFCAVCHGYQGKGDGPVSVKMALKPPPLISDKIKNVPDGAIFHIISDGQGVMSSYAYQLVNEKDRWAIVNYVRSLQKLAK
jgi:mono/diheme cytochrome c family protein